MINFKIKNQVTKLFKQFQIPLTLNFIIMKKTILLTAALLFAAIFHDSFGKNPEPLTTGEPDRISTLVIDANVTVVLVSNEKAVLEMAGDRALTKYVTLKRLGDTLVISSEKSKDLTSSGYIYVPANQLREIRINGEANLQSLYFLRVPKLDVIINAVCKIDISSIGELNFIETANYTFDRTTKVRRLPASILLAD